jgi:group I intron endonuclease
MTCGIYQITNIINRKIYVGSSKNIEKRWIKGHRSVLRNNKHTNSYLQRAWNKYGVNAFKIEILETCQPEDRRTIEQYYLDWLEPWDRGIGYNQATTVSGEDPTEETRKKMSASQKGKHLSEITKKKIGDSERGEKHHLFGKHPSKETRLKMSLAHKGKPSHRKGKSGKSWSEERKKTQQNLMLGKKHSEEAKRKISEKHKGKQLTEEHKEKLSIAHKGQIISTNTRRLISLALTNKKKPPRTEEHKENLKKAMRKYRQKLHQLHQKAQEEAPTEEV